MKINNILATGLFFLHVLTASAGLLGVNPGFPKVSFSTTVSTAQTYNPTNQLFLITTTPTTMLFSSSEGPRLISGTKTLQMQALVDNNGNLVSGTGGNDLFLSGTVTRTVNGVLNTYTGTLLTGKITAFGWYPSGGVGQYDMRFTATGGQLLSFFSCGDVAVSVMSGSSTFTGSFTVPFNGRVSGLFGQENIVPPIIQCPTNITVESQAFSGGIPGAYVSFPLPMVTDNCDTNPTIVFTPPSGTFFPLPTNGEPTATYSVLCVATDVSGNSNSCSFLVTVEDTLPPEFADPNNPVIFSDLVHPINLTNDSGQAYATYTFPEPYATDNTLLTNFPATVTAVDGNGANIPLQNLGNGYMQGQFPVGGECVITVTASDEFGNTAQHQAGVDVVDTEPPVISCPGNQVVSYTNGPVFFDVATASDNCPGVTVTCTPPSGSVLAIGVNTIECVATDASGNQSDCSFTVTMRPSLKYTPANVTVPTDPGQCSAVVNFPASAIDQNSIPITLTYNPPSGAAYPKGITVVTCSGSDANGDTGSWTFNVTVNDLEKPVIIAPAAVTVSTDPGECQASVVALGTPATSDNCGVASVVSNAPAIFPKGVTVVTWTVTDTSGNQATATQTVTVVDTEKPVIIAPAALTVNTDPGECQASAVALGTPVTSDNCGVASVVNNAPAIFPKGETVVTWTVTDTSSNQAVATQVVIVEDLEAPVIQPVQDIVTALSGLCMTAVPVTFTNPVVTDNCGVSNVVCTPPSGSLFPLGTNKVVCIATDTSGNTATNSFNVIVNPLASDALAVDLECCRVGFDLNRKSDYVWFRGNLTLSDGSQSTDFRTATNAFGAVKVTFGTNTPIEVFCADGVPFNVTQDADCDTEQWIYETLPTEQVLFRFKEDQHYSANMDPNLPVSAATGNRNVGNLESVFIDSGETRFRYAFANANLPITITVDGIVLLSVDPKKSVISAFPYWICGKTVEVLFPERLVPANTIAWYAASNSAAVSPTNLIYSQTVSANGNATDTYYNEGGRFFIRVPVPGIDFSSQDRLATVQFVVGQPGKTKLATGSFTVPLMRTVGVCWKFGDCSDDADEDDEEDYTAD